MKTMIVDRNDVARIVAHVGLDGLMDEMIERITDVTLHFDQSRTIVHPRDGFRYTEPEVGLLEWMPVMHTGDTTTIKVVGYHPANPSTRNLPTIVSTISAYDTATGHLIGLTDGTFVTALRTGAASAVASRVLARPDSTVLGLVGCGAQAITQLHALLRAFPIRRVLVHDVDSRNMESLGGRARSVLAANVTVQPCALNDLVQSADIVCTSTSIGIGEGPLFEDLDTKPWLHINAVGADFPGKVELPKALLKRSLVCPDQVDQALKEGECQQLERGEIGPSLVELVADPQPYRGSRDRTTVYDSTGWALHDRAAIELVLDHAERLGLGVPMEIEVITEDPLSPYELVQDGGAIDSRRAGAAAGGAS